MHSIVQETSTPPLELLRQQWEREAQEQRQEAKAQAKLERAAAAEQARIAKVEPEEVLPPVPEPPPPEYRYGLTAGRRQHLARALKDFPQLARELHVWATVYAAPYTTDKALAEACAENSDIAVRTWRRIIKDMKTREQLRMGLRGFETIGSLDPRMRPQKSTDAAKRLVNKMGEDVGPRDPSKKAARVRRVLRNGRRPGRGIYYSSVVSLATACAKNGSGTVAGYRRTIEKMLAMPELTRRDSAFGHSSYIDFIDGPN